MRTLVLCQPDPGAEQRVAHPGTAIAGRTLTGCVEDGTRRRRGGRGHWPRRGV